MVNLSERIQHRLPRHRYFFVGLAEALAQLGRNIDQQARSGTWVRLEILLQSGAINFPNLGISPAHYAGAGIPGVKNIHFANSGSRIERAQQNGTSRGLRLDVKRSGNDQKKSILRLTFLNEAVSIHQRDKLPIGTQLSPLLRVKIRGKAHSGQNGIFGGHA